MVDLTTKVADILTEQCGHESEWMPTDRQILDLAVEADERESELRAEIERLREALLGVRAYFLETGNIRAVAKVDEVLFSHEQQGKGNE